MARLKKNEWFVAVDKSGNLCETPEKYSIMNKRLYLVEEDISAYFPNENQKGIRILKMLVRIDAKSMAKFGNSGK